MTPFVIIGTPRSRTAWLARFLSYGGRTCLHEPSLQFDKEASLSNFLSDDSASATDCMMSFMARDIRVLRPDCVIVSVRRPLPEVHESFAKLGIAVPEWYLKLMDDDAASADVDLAVSFNDLNSEHVCRMVFETCLKQPMDRAWWLHLKDENIQSDVRETMRTIVRDNARLGAVFGKYYAL